MAGRDFNISVQSNLKSAVARLEVRSNKLVEASAVRALNRTATTVRAEAAKLIRQRYNIKSSVIKAQMRIIRARRGNLTAEVIAFGRKRIPLIEFAVGNVALHGIKFRASHGNLRVAASGFGRKRPLVRTKVLHQQGTKTWRHAFVARMPTGHVGIFERTGQFKRRGDPKLEKIKQLFGPNIPQTFTHRSIRAAMRRVAEQRFITEFERDLRFRAGI
jgi:hypothetical protein